MPTTRKRKNNTDYQIDKPIPRLSIPQNTRRKSTSMRKDEESILQSCPLYFCIFAKENNLSQPDRTPIHKQTQSTH